MGQSVLAGYARDSFRCSSAAGDIVTHIVCAPHQNGILDEQGRPFPDVTAGAPAGGRPSSTWAMEARPHFELGSWVEARPDKQGFLARTTLSTDWTAQFAAAIIRGVIDLPRTVMVEIHHARHGRWPRWIRRAATGKFQLPARCYFPTFDDPPARSTSAAPGPTMTIMELREGTFEIRGQLQGALATGHQRLFPFDDPCLAGKADSRGARSSLVAAWFWLHCVLPLDKRRSGDGPHPKISPVDRVASGFVSRSEIRLCPPRGTSDSLRL